MGKIEFLGNWSYRRTLSLKRPDASKYFITYKNAATNDQVSLLLLSFMFLLFQSASHIVFICRQPVEIGNVF